MSSPLVPPSGYFQLCTQDNDIFLAHPCSQWDDVCDFNDHVAFPLGSTSSSNFCFFLNLAPVQIVSCSEHCCVWDLLVGSFASSFVLFASSFCYSTTTHPHAEENVMADGKSMCPCSCHPPSPDLTATRPPSVLTGSSGMLQIWQRQTFQSSVLSSAF